MNISTADLRKALQVLGLATSTKSSLPPATRLIELVTEDGFLYGYTFNKVCYLKYKICPSTEDICVNVDFNLLFSLVKGVDGDTIKITHKNNSLTFTSSKFTTKIQCFISQNDGKLIPHIDEYDSYPYHFDADMKDYMALSKFINPKIAVNCYTGMYFGDNIMVSDINNVAIIRDHLFPSNILLNPTGLSLITDLKEFDYNINPKERALFIKTNEVIGKVYTMPLDEFQYDDYVELFDINIADSIELESADFVKAIATANKLKFKELNLTFCSKGVALSGDRSNFQYLLSKTPCTMDITYKMNISTLQKMILGDKMTVFYGNTDFIKIVNDIKEVLLGEVTVKTEEPSV